MRKLLLLALLLPTAAAAGPSLGLRLGWAPGSGDASDGNSMADVAASHLPIQLDALWRFGERFSAGAYFSWGVALLEGEVADRCDTLGADCSVSVFRLGLEGTYAFTQASQRFTPWVGAGIGYEWVRSSVSSAGFSGSQRLGGWEVANVQAGADWPVSRRLAIGPFAMVSIGRYSSVDGNEITEKGWHQWLTLGVRGTLDL